MSPDIMQRPLDGGGGRPALVETDRSAQPKKTSFSTFGMLRADAVLRGGGVYAGRDLGLADEQSGWN